MIHRTGSVLLSLALAATGALSCSDDNNRPKDSGPPPTDSQLYACTEPGKSCNAHDPCAINPICGADQRCHPERIQDCSDGLDCTIDSCIGPGQCKNEPKDGTCALTVKDKDGSVQVQCFVDKDINPGNPCQGCNPKESKSKWSGATGGTCDDGNLCTMDDYCEAGDCKGTYYGNKCSDGLGCTDDICDGKGGCSNKLRADSCLIGKSCYKDKDTDPTRCLVCDVTKSQSAWTTVPNTCKIGGTCFKPNDTDVTGCGVCDPTRSPTTWSAMLGTCFIAGVCVKPGDPDATGCAACDPTKSTTDWTPLSGRCLIDGVCRSSGDKSASGCGLCDPTQSAVAWSTVSGASTSVNGFEGSLGGYTVDTPANGVGWQLSTARAKTGTASLYYGNPTGGSYDNGAANSGAATSPAIALPAGQKAALTFWLYLDVESSPSHDVLQVKAGSTVVWTKDATTMPPASYRRWVPIEVNLSSLAGQSVKISFAFDTKDAWANSGEGVFIDDVAVITGCGS
jgi:hypothetical protein